MSTIIPILLLIFTAISLKSRNYGMMIVLAGLPSYLLRFSVFGFPTTFLEMMILILFAIWLVRDTEFINFLKGEYKIKDFLKNKQFRSRYPFATEIVLMLIISYIAMAISGFSVASMGIWKAYFFEPALFYILLFNTLFKEKKILEKTLLPLCISAVFLSIFAIGQKITGQAWIGDATRFSSIYPYPNALGLFLAPLIFIFAGWGFYLWIKNKKQVSDTRSSGCRTPVFCFIATLLSCLAIYLAKSEGAILGVLAGVIIFAFLSAGKRKFWVALVILILIFAGSAQKNVRDYFYEKATLTDLSGEIRKQQWRETWKMLLDGRILTGAGLAGYPETVEPYHQEGIFFNHSNDPNFRNQLVWGPPEYKARHWQPTEIYLYPHNFFLNFWTELGMAGMILFSWIVIKFFIIARANLRQKKYIYLNAGLVGAMTAILVHGLVDVPYFKNDLAILFWVLIALVGVLNMEESNK